MSDQYREVETVGYFTRLKNSIFGIFLGIVLFVASFGVLYWNEGRVDLSKVAQTSVEIPGTGAPGADIGSFVSLSGTLNTSETIGDNPFLAPGDYVALERTSEMYAWREDSSTSTTKNVGGSETKTTTYSYTKVWTESPENSSSFRESSSHQNPTKGIESQSFRVNQAQIGDYQLDMQSLKFPVKTEVNLSPSNILPAYHASQVGNYLFMGTGKLDAPQIGDLRLSYRSLNNNVQATVFGTLVAQNKLIPYKGQRNVTFYRLFTETRDQAIASLKTEHKIITLVLRVVGFLMMWSGLNLMIEPLGVLLDFIPFLGNLSRTASGFVTFIVAGILSGITIVVAIILHNPIMLFLAAGLGGFGVYRWTKRRKTNLQDST
jgi:hypothetical protein